LFKILNTPNDTVSQGDRDWIGKGPAPSLNDTQGYVEKALEPYGGIPKDAVLSSVNIGASEGTYNGATGIETDVADERCANYNQVLYGIPITGHGGYLNVCITGGGNPDLISKHWKSVEEVGMERVIPASEAILRLKNYDGMFNPPTRTSIYDYIPDMAFNLTITGMKMGYFASNDTANETYIEPVWIISAIDTIRSMPFTFYIPASYNPGQYDLNNDLFGNQRNFSQVKGIMPGPDISFPQTILMGTSGPIGTNAAQDAVRQFIENPGLNLTYNGRFLSSSNACEGGYQGEYYSFNTSDCQFQVDVFTGSIILASINESCITPGFSGKYVTGNITKEEAISLAENFAREKYPLFDKKHMIYDNSTYLEKSGYGDYYPILYIGDFSAVSDSGIEILVRYRDGLIETYSVTDDYLDTLCIEDSVVRIDE
jgi:hypothetical protein